MSMLLQSPTGRGVGHAESRFTQPQASLHFITAKSHRGDDLEPLPRRFACIE